MLPAPPRHRHHVTPSLLLFFAPCRANKRWDDATVSPVIRQTLLHWAFELTAEEFERMRRQL